MNAVREVLQQIDELLAEGGTNAQQLWDVLVALRGPDDKDADTKRASTERIRAIAFPIAARAKAHPMERVNVDGGEITVRDMTSHFGWHVAKAKKALQALGRI